MDGNRVYLKPNVQAEPLVNQWYAWSHLISPANAAMYMANSHLRILQSFTANPQIHINALKNPQMRGGPFIHYGKDRLGEIKELTERTLQEQSHMFGLAEAIKELDKTLMQEVNGHSLEPLYSKVPRDLRGFVELVYDLNNYPSVRFIEGLLYKSRYYARSAQSLCLSLMKDDHRPFVFSTPRLEDDGTLFVNIPFDHEGIDELFKMKTESRPLGHVKEALNIGDASDDLLSTFFTEERTPSYPPYTGDGVRVRYFGHACVLVETKEINVLCDPVISYRYDSEIYRYTYSDLPDRLDYVLITHNHQDHCMLETLLQLRHKIGCVIVPKNNGGKLSDPSLKLALQSIGFRNVLEVDDMESIAVAGGAVTGLPFLGEHGDLDIRSKAAYLVRLKERSILCMADSNNIEPLVYEHIKDRIGNVDVLFLGMECDGAPLSWVYAPLLTRSLSRGMDQSRRLDGSNHEKAMGIVTSLNPARVFVYAMGQEPWLTYVTSIKYTDESRPIVESNKLVKECRARGIVADRLFGHCEIHL
jgi:L-ascorbate metabolism protein UlaG (beta-lactamase superfamily)